jgi:formyltetrahydrofolate deformylase
LRVTATAAPHSNGNGSAASGGAAQNTSSSPLSTTADSAPAKTALKKSPKKESIPKSSIYVANLLVRCPDAKGVVASLSQLLYGMNCNVVTSDQFSDLDEGHFYQRITLDYSDLLVGPGNTAVLEHGIREVAQRFNMDWKIAYRTKRKRVALLVSKMDHCLYDLLIRHESGELDCDIPVVISNWNDLAPVAAKFDIPFRHLPVNTKEPGSKEAQEAALEALLEELDIDVIVLARYMQIFSPAFADKYWKKTINVHHSFLPAFHGARPYHRAHERGVKLIGATAHYATSDLDCGPIIDQDVTRVTHRDGISDMIRKGRDLERLVLSRALRWHLNDRVVVTGNEGKTVVFED